MQRVREISVTRLAGAVIEFSYVQSGPVELLLLYQNPPVDHSEALGLTLTLTQAHALLSES